MTQQQSVVIGDLVVTAPEVLRAAMALIQEDENVRLKIVNKIRASQNQVLLQKVELLEKNRTGDGEGIPDAGPHEEGTDQEGDQARAEGPDNQEEG
jgi:hypothetical protein